MDKMETPKQFDDNITITCDSFLRHQDTTQDKKFLYIMGALNNGDLHYRNAHFHSDNSGRHISIYFQNY